MGVVVELIKHLLAAGKKDGADEADGEMMGTPGRNAEKPRSPSPFGAQDAIEEGKEGAAK